LKNRLPIVFLAKIQTKTFFIIYHMITHFMIVLVNFPIIIMHKMCIMTTCELFFVCLCTLLEAWWKFHVDMARYLYAHVFKTSWEEWEKQWNVSTNILYKFFKVNNSHLMLILQDWDSQLKSRNQVNVFDTCTKCN